MAVAQLQEAPGPGCEPRLREVLWVLLSFAVKYGQAYPSHATIAKLACCSERTVADALHGCGCGASYRGSAG